jgi:hypothetical protein
MIAHTSAYTGPGYLFDVIHFFLQLIVFPGRRKKVKSVSVAAVSLHFTTALKAWPRQSACSEMLQERMIRVFFLQTQKFFNNEIYHVGT